MLLYHAVLAFCGFLYSRRAEEERQELDATPSEELPRVTVLIPAHNEELVIERTLLAVGNMNYPRDRLEVICCNDNS